MATHWPTPVAGSLVRPPPGQLQLQIALFGHPLANSSYRRLFWPPAGQLQLRGSQTWPPAVRLGRVATNMAMHPYVARRSDLAATGQIQLHNKKKKLSAMARSVRWMARSSPQRADVADMAVQWPCGSRDEQTWSAAARFGLPAARSDCGRPCLAILRSELAGGLLNKATRSLM